jgi:hypothetical protein
MSEVFVFKGAEYVVNTTANTFTVNSSGSYAAPSNVGPNNQFFAHMTLRIVNLNTASHVLTLSNTTFSGNLTMQGNSVIFLQKNVNDLLASDVANATPNIFAGVCGFSY